MSLNHAEIDVVLQELDLAGAFIQQIIQPGYDSIAFYIYKNSIQKKTAVASQCLFICLASGVCRLHATKQKIPKSDKPLRFMEFLKSRIRGCKIESLEQLDQNRIVKMSLSRTGESFFMFIRLWSGAANIIVTDENLKILDVFYRRPKRGETSGGVFFLPEQSAAINEKSVQAAPQKKFILRDFSDLKESGQGKNFDNLSFNEKVDLWYSEHGSSLSREALFEQAEKAYTVRKSRMEAALERLESKRQAFLAGDQLKHQGDLILSFAHLIDSAKKSPYLECVDYDTGNSVRIEIDPKKNAHENAQSYYNRYKKTLSGLAELEYDIQSLKKQLLNANIDWKIILQEQNPVRMQQLIKKQTKSRQQIEKKHPGLSFSIDSWNILVGRTASENDELLRRHVKGQDIWLHTRDWAGGYVFIKNQRGKTVPLEILLDAGNLAVFYSKARKAKTADLYYTQVKHLRRAKNAPRGTVLPSNEKNISITLDADRLKKIEGQQHDSF